VYSICARTPGHGLGDRAYQAILAAHRADALEAAFLSSSPPSGLPPSRIHQWGWLGRGLKYLGARDRSGLLPHLEAAAFDTWASLRLPAADVFCGWLGAAARTLRRARAMGTPTVLDCPCSHPTSRLGLLREEAERWGVAWRPPSWNHDRLVLELGEANRVLVPSDFVRDSLIEAGLPAAKLVRLPFGVDLERFHPPQPKGAPDARPSRPFRVLFAGQVCLRKGVPDLLDAWRRLGWRDAELAVVGDLRPDFSELRGRWADAPGVRFLPHSSEIPELLRQCDVFALPTIEEGSARVAQEALATGRPVVTTPHAGSWVRDGVEGFMVPIRDPDALADALQRLRDDEPARAEMGRAARRRAEAFPWQRYRRRLVDELQKAAAQ
jgi:glycosyltransferase involved in cell wall biosynthesis